MQKKKKKSMMNKKNQKQKILLKLAKESSWYIRIWLKAKKKKLLHPSSFSQHMGSLIYVAV